MLEELLGSKSRARLVSLLVVAGGAPLHMRELVRLSGGSISSVQRDVERLEAMGLVASAVDAKGRRQVSLVSDHPFAKPLEGLVAADPRAQYGARSASIPNLDPQSARALGEYVDAIVTSFDPIRIVLFGSRARGTAREDSDIDLLVVLPQVEDRRKAMVEIKSAIGFHGRSIDVVPTDPESIERELRLRASAVREALDEGTVVYERSA